MIRAGMPGEPVTTTTYPAPASDVPRVGDLTHCVQVGHYGQHTARPECLVIDSRGRCQTPRAAAPAPADDVAVCRWCERRIVLMDGSWTDPDATGDDAMWRQVCDENEATFTGEHDPN